MDLWALYELNESSRSWSGVKRRFLRILAKSEIGR